MKRRKFVTKAAAFPIIGSSLLSEKVTAQSNTPVAAENEIYEYRQYELIFGRPQQALENYFKDALIPGLNRQGIKRVGVFKELGMSTPVKVHVLIAHPNIQSFYEASAKLSNDTTYQKASKSFEEKSSAETVYRRYSTWVLRAFDGLKQMEKTKTDEDRLFEIRTYEGHNDNAVSRKTAMFDIEEIELFYKTNLNPVFFGKMIAGPAMPALVYMLQFKDMQERDANWKTFLTHPEWNTMKVKPAYVDSVSNIVRVFLKPTDYSQI